MAVPFSEVQNRIILVLYDYMLSSDDEAFWFSISEIREGLGPEIAGSFVYRAVNALVENDSLELGEADGADPNIYTLTDKGIQAAEQLLKLKGIDLSQYEPAPSADRIISRIEEPDLYKEISLKLAEIRQEVQESNEVGSRLGDEKDFVAAELEAATAITSKDRFRLRRVAALIIPTLRYLADKFVGQGVGELAKQLADLLMKLL